MNTLFFYLILFFSFSEATLAEQPNLRDLPRHPRRVKAGEWARQDILSVDCNGSNNYGKTRFTYSFDDDFSFSVTNNLMGEIRDQYSAPAVDNLKNDNTSESEFLPDFKSRLYFLFWFNSPSGSHLDGIKIFFKNKFKSGTQILDGIIYGYDSHVGPVPSNGTYVAPPDDYYELGKATCKIELK